MKSQSAQIEVWRELGIALVDSQQQVNRARKEFFDK